jgi:leader peptidase (prepilin peptidase)/N-methyltransferase
MLRVLATVFAGLLGLAFGSFLNVCLSRWPAGESVVRPRSHCRNCGRTLTWWENVPLVSWLALRGHCRTCKAAIGWRYPLVELAVGSLWACSAWKSTALFVDPRVELNSPDAVLAFIQLEHGLGRMAFLWALTCLAFLDAEHFWLPDRITIPGTLIGVLFEAVWAAQVQWFFMLNPALWFLKTLGIRVLCAAGAAGAILLIRWLYWLIRRREGIGLGDAKLMAMLAAWLGLAGTLLAFAIGVIAGAVVALIILVAAKRQSETSRLAHKQLPLGTFLCIGGIVSSLWGQPIIDAYLRLAGF